MKMNKMINVGYDINENYIKLFCIEIINRYETICNENFYLFKLENYYRKRMIILRKHLLEYDIIIFNVEEDISDFIDATLKNIERS